MGAKISSVAFFYSGNNESLKDIVEHWINKNELSKDDNGFSDVFIERKNDLVIIYNIPVLHILTTPTYLEILFEDTKFFPEYFFVFLGYNFSDSYGYALYKNGKHVRTVYQLGYLEQKEPVCIGQELDFEHKYFTADYYFIDLNLEDPEKIKSLPEEIISDSHFEKYFIVNNEEISATTLIESAMMDFSTQYLGFNIVWDEFESDETIVIQSNKRVSTVKKHKEVNANRFISWFTHLFKGKILK